MKQFPIYPLMGENALPPSFRCGVGDKIECSFVAEHEYQVDAVITALTIIRSSLRRNYKPLDRSKSLSIQEPSND